MSKIKAPIRPNSGLVAAFEANEFDVAGLADMPLDGDALKRALHELYLILFNRSQPRPFNRERLAQVLFAMIAVARDDYAQSGYQEYWPYLFDRIEVVQTGEWGAKEFANLRCQASQALLGEWFLLALNKFGYTIPNEGLKYVGPVVFHSGIPRTSLPGVIGLINTAVGQYGRQAVNLPCDLRFRLVKNHTPPLHRNVERLLASRLRGASQLWSCLARVVLAWRLTRDCTEEVRHLPPALDPELVRKALEGLDSTKPSSPRIPLPQIRFDANTGEVRLTLPSGSPSNWRVAANGQTLDLRWDQTHVGLTAEFVKPLPIAVDIASKANSKIGRNIVTRAKDSCAIWFHASNGNIEDGEAVAANGLEPGRWYVLLEGTPTRWNTPSVSRLPLKWSYFAGSQQWTAWEVEIPPRSANQTELVWSLDGQPQRVSLARRPGARIDLCSEPVAYASKETGEKVAVFPSPPIVRLCRDRSQSIVVLRETGDDLEVVQSGELPPNQEWRVPVDNPGIYQLREARGVGRTLLHFALTPALKIKGPIYDRAKSRVDIELVDRGRIAQAIVAAGDSISCRDDTYRHKQATTEPFLELEFQWRDNATCPMMFQWPVEGLRWRVLRLSEDAARWTREPVFVSPGDVAKHDAQLEIQFPSDSELRVNEVPYSTNLQKAPTGRSLTLSLLPFGELVEVGVDGEPPRPTVVKTDRPVVDRIEAILDGETVLLEWSGALPEDAVLVAWSTLEPLADEAPIRLSPEQINQQACEISLSELPGKEWSSLVIGRVVRRGFTQQILYLAAARGALSRPASLLLSRTSGVAKALTTASPADWVEFLHYLTLDRLNRTSTSAEQIARFLAALPKDERSRLDLLLELDGRLELSDGAAHNEWRMQVRQALAKHAQHLISAGPSTWLRPEIGSNADEIVRRVLRMGVPIGWSCPFKWLADDAGLNEFTCTYPFAFICDLWLLGTPEADVNSQIQASTGQGITDWRERQRLAANRVWEFLTSCGLSRLTQLLPIAQKELRTSGAEGGHAHCVTIAPRRIESAEDFADALGLDDLGFDAYATCDDPFWKEPPRRFQQGRRARAPHSPDDTLGHNHTTSPDYSLFWDVGEQQWYIDRPGASPRTCCQLSKSPLFAGRPQLIKLIDNIDLRRILNEWAQLDAAHAGSPDLSPQLAGLGEQLGSDPVTGALHRELLAAPEIEKKELL